MTTTLEIWDAVAEDIPRCLELDRTSETQRVWQISIREDNNNHTINLRPSELSQPLQVTMPPYPQRLERALGDNHCFLVAVAPADEQIYGYIVMLQAFDERSAQLKEIVVAAEARRQGIALRLLRTAKKWANEHHLRQITAEAQTTNYPAIALYQKAGYRFCGYNEQHFQNQDIAVFFCQTLRK